MSVPLLLLLGSVPSSVFGQLNSPTSAANPPRIPPAPIVKPASGVSTQTTSTALPPGPGLIGATVSWQYWAYGGPYDSPSTFVVNGAVGGQFLGDFDISGSANSITFDYSVFKSTQPDTWSPSALSLPPTIHNGVAIDMISGPPFLEVIVDPATNMVGFDASRISFTSNQIQVDWQNLSYTESTIVKLDVITPNASLCLQDQYGGQYNFTVSADLSYVYGTANEPGCDTPTWNLIGTFTKTATGLDLALTAANPTPGGCVTLFTLSGTYPNFKWLYQSGMVNPQPSSYVYCGLPAPRSIAGQGALK